MGVFREFTRSKSAKTESFSITAAKSLRPRAKKKVYDAGTKRRLGMFFEKQGFSVRHYIVNPIAVDHCLIVLSGGLVSAPWLGRSTYSVLRDESNLISRLLDATRPRIVKADDLVVH